MNAMVVRHPKELTAQMVFIRKAFAVVSFKANTVKKIGIVDGSINVAYKNK